MITVLAGGVGAARFLQGLIQLIDPRELTVISNIGDDIEIWGLRISPDIDIVIYTLAGMVDETKGWGINEDTFFCLEAIQRYRMENWFQLGDRDLATHIFRTHRLRDGWTLSEITRALCEAFGVVSRVLPMSDETVQTKIVTDSGLLHFQEYLVKRKAVDAVRNVLYEGNEAASPTPEVLESIRNAKRIIIAPSNPIASIGPILSIKGVRAGLRETKAPIIAVSPIVAGKPLKGPADKMMAGLGLDVSARQVAQLYRDFLDCFVIDNVDSDLKKEIESGGVRVVATNTIMKTLEDKKKLAEAVLLALE